VFSAVIRHKKIGINWGLGFASTAWYSTKKKDRENVSETEGFHSQVRREASTVLGLLERANRTQSLGSLSV
jgi:hypothetical protein